MSLCALTPWFVENWTELLPHPWGAVALAFAASICGGIVGSERERREKPAGMRTLVLVCLGSAVFTMISFAFSTSTGDSGRVAAQIVTGIGFLGAGVILHGRGTVSGATTAATIWVVAAIGIVAGVGYVGGAIGLSLLVRVVLAGARLIELHGLDKITVTAVDIDFDPDFGKTRIRMEHVLADFSVPESSIKWTLGESGPSSVALKLRLQHRHLRELLDRLVAIPQVKSVREAEVSGE